MKEFQRKVKVICHVPWSHHHTGWPYCVSGLYRHLNIDHGIRLYTNSIVTEVFFSDSPQTRPWIGVLHAVPDEEIAESFKSPACSKSLSLCKGIYALSDVVRDFIIGHASVPSETLRLAVGPPKCYFDPTAFAINPNPKLIMIGHWMRRFESIYNLQQTTFEKCILRCTNKIHPAGVTIIDYVEADEYESLFKDNVVFLDLEGASANNTIIECIVRNTPIVVNRLPAIEEYLGKSYPLFYDSLEQADEILSSKESILEGHIYLKSIDKTVFTLDAFVESVAESSIYKNLQLPKMYA